jgi:hypothetical protein
VDVHPNDFDLLENDKLLGKFNSFIEELKRAPTEEEAGWGMLIYTSWQNAKVLRTKCTENSESLPVYETFLKLIR